MDSRRSSDEASATSVALGLDLLVCCMRCLVYRNGEAHVMSQAHVILQMLERGPVTALDALEETGCFRLAARIADLRRLGHDIRTENITTANGKRIAKYVLKESTSGQQSHPQHNDVCQPAASAHGRVEVPIAK
jgi:hypothetical protein